VSAERVREVTVPLGLIQAGEDELVLPDEGDELAAIARAHRCPRASVTTVPGADHVFTGCDEELIAACEAWLASLLE
jgi:fermentation-respiration switch protein FrsA (DUF1100 family)